MKTTKKILSVFLSVLIAAMTCASFGSLAFAEGAAVFASGECGDQGGNVTWTLTTDGVLTISGTGAMASGRPWDPEMLMETSGAYEAELLQLCAAHGYVFNSIAEAEAYAQAHPEFNQEPWLQEEAPVIFYRIYNTIPVVKTVVIEEGVTAIPGGVFYARSVDITLPASMTEVGELLVDGRLTVEGTDTDLSHVYFRVCQDGYSFATREDRDAYETVQNKYWAVVSNVAYYMTEFTDEDVRNYMAEHEGMTEEEARAEMQHNAELGARQLGASFGVAGGSAEEILQNAMRGIDGILGTSFADDEALLQSFNKYTVYNWYENTFKPALYLRFFGITNPTTVNAQDHSATLDQIGGNFHPVPWVTVEARCDSLARTQIEGKGVNFVSLGGHDLVNHNAKAPTCGAIGWDAYDTCSKCDYTTYAEKPATGEHTWGEWTVATPATATADGVKTRECSVCHTTEEDVIPAAGTPDQPGAPDNPGQSDSGQCVCGETHTGFFGKLITFFHKIIYFFKNLFQK